MKKIFCGLALALTFTLTASAAEIQITATAHLKGDSETQSLYEQLNVTAEKVGTDALMKSFRTSDRLVTIECKKLESTSQKAFDCEVRLSSRAQGLNVGLGNGILVKDGEIIAMILNANDAGALFDLLKTDTVTGSATHFSTSDERLKISCTPTMCNVSISSTGSRLN